MIRRERQTRSPEVAAVSHPSRMEEGRRVSRFQATTIASLLSLLLNEEKRAATFLDCSSARGDEILKPSLSSAAAAPAENGMEKGARTDEERERERGVWAWAEVFNGAVSMNCETRFRVGLYLLGR